MLYTYCYISQIIYSSDNTNIYKILRKFKTIITNFLYCFYLFLLISEKKLNIIKYFKMLCYH